MLQLAADVARDPAARTLLGNPEISDDDKVGLIVDIGGDKFDKAGCNFVKLLADNDRLAVLPEIAAIFETLRAEAEKTIHAELTAAFAVSEEQREKIAAALKGRLKRDVVLECKVDESLIGGAIIRAGDLIIDGSAKGQLAKLSVALRQ
jgi:F-type H+-transporting ATPase subunit delta